MARTTRRQALTGIALGGLSAARTSFAGATGAPKYEPNWQSLAQHEGPEWLKDAKFGIYAHWGVYSVPAFETEWYGKLMYDPANPRGVYEHHVKTYGGPAKFGYHKFIPEFRAEKFNPYEWSDIVSNSGVKYAGIAVVHHDGFGLWSSKITPWNVGQMGPKRDLYGDLVAAYRKKGLKILATFHHLRTFNWYLPEKAEYIEQGRKEGWDLFDSKYAQLYWNHFTSNYEAFLTEWQARVHEVIDRYHPDVLWFDGGNFQDPKAAPTVTEALAYYYNCSAARSQPVEVLNKFAANRKFNFPREFGTLTFEGGRDRPAEVDRPWTDDLSISQKAWGYRADITYRTPKEIINGLIDRVSRGGGLVVSLAPKADGTIPDEQKQILAATGAWLRVNGEAIYATRPWKIHAEGDEGKLHSLRGGHLIWDFNKCDASDVRFTRKGNVLYAIAMGWPPDGKFLVKSLADRANLPAGAIASVKLLGHDGPVSLTRDASGLTLEARAADPKKPAYTFRIEPKGSLRE